MDRSELLKKLGPMLDDYEKNQTFGSIELCFNRGHVEVIRQLKSEKFKENREHTHDFIRNK
jgi:hypothetical protein